MFPFFLKRIRLSSGKTAVYKRVYVRDSKRTRNEMSRCYTLESFIVNRVKTLWINASRGELETLCSSGKLRVNIIVSSRTRVHRVRFTNNTKIEFPRRHLGRAGSQAYHHITFWAPVPTKCFCGPHTTLPKNNTTHYERYSGLARRLKLQNHIIYYNKNLFQKLQTHINGPFVLLLVTTVDYRNQPPKRML